MNTTDYNFIFEDVEEVDEIYDPYNPDHIFKNIEIIASNVQYYALQFINYFKLF